MNDNEGNKYSIHYLSSGIFKLKFKNACQHNICDRLDSYKWETKLDMFTLITMYPCPSWFTPSFTFSCISIAIIGHVTIYAAWGTAVLTIVARITIYDSNIIQNIQDLKLFLYYIHCNAITVLCMICKV